MNRKYHIYQQQGFSLYEMMIAVGLMGVVSLGMLSVQKSGMMTQKTVIAQDDARVLTDEIARMVSDSTSCMNSFGGINPVTGVTYNVAGNQVFKDKTSLGSVTRFTVGSIYGNRTLKLNSVSIGGSGVASQVQASRWVATGPNTGTALVLIDWQQTGSAGNRGVGPQSIYRYFTINATISGSNLITACSVTTGNNSGGGSGSVNSTPLWLTNKSLGNSVLTQSGSSIGINTASPGALLDVSNGATQCCASQTPNISLAQASSTNGLYSWLQFHNAGESEAYIRLAGGAASGARSGSRRLEIGDSQSVGTSLTLTGYLGIGTTAPGAPLTISSSSNSQVTASRAGYAGFRLDSDSAGKYYIYDGAGNAWNQTIVSSGSSVGIGDSSGVSIPRSDLYVNGITRLGTSTNADAYVVIFSHAATGRLAMQGENAAKNAKKDIIINAWGGNVGIGAQAPAYLLQVGNSGDGTQARANAWNAFSDLGLKDIIGKIPNACEKIDQLNGYYYTWKKGSDKSRQVGVIAQEVEKVLPEIVSTGSDGIKSLDYSRLTAVLIESTKELNHQQSPRENKILNQAGLINVLQTRLKELISSVEKFEGRIKKIFQASEGNLEAVYESIRGSFKKFSADFKQLEKRYVGIPKRLNKLELKDSDQIKTIGSLKNTFIELKRKNEALKKDNLSLQRESESIVAYLCAKDAHARICH